MEIETKNATLATMAVTIQALHVNGKQMTLAVFRQLPIRLEESSDDVWGTVRYSIKGEGDLWIVFSKDGRLYRRSLCLDPVRRDSSRLNSLRREIEKTERSLIEFSWIRDKTSLQENLNLLKMELQSEILKVEKLFERDTKRLQYEERLEKMQQLFIAV